MQKVPTCCFSITVVVVHSLESQPKVLLLKRRDTLVGEWCPVSGRIEGGETAWQAGLRELKEETSLTPKKYFSADLCETYYDVKREQISIEPIFLAFAEQKEIVLDHEHSDYIWVSFEEAFDLVPFPKHRRILRHVFTEFFNRKPVNYLALPTQSR